MKMFCVLVAFIRGFMYKLYITCTMGKYEKFWPSESFDITTFGNQALFSGYDAQANNETTGCAPTRCASREYN
jgi:hypothetical protein